MKRSTGLRGVILAATVVLAVGAFAALSGTAGAIVVKLADGRTVSYLGPTRGALASPFARAADGAAEAAGSGKLTYHGGPIMPASHIYLFLWSPGGLAGYPAGYVEGLERYFGDLAAGSGTSTNVQSVDSQYGDSEGHHAEYSVSLAGTLVDEAAYPKRGCTAAASCLTEAQLSGQLHSYVEAHKLPTGLESVYFILTPPKVESCFESNSRECSAGTSAPAYCAFHGFTEVAGSTLVFGVDPYSVGIEGCDTFSHPSGLASEGEIQGGLSHELSEMLTDPRLNAWYATSGEIGDLCRTFVNASEFGTPLGTAEDGAPYNQLINGDEYYYQQEWSNEAGGCAQRRTTVKPAVTGLTPRTGPAAGGTTVLIQGSSFVGVSAVRFGNVPASSYQVLSATSIEAVAPAGTSGSAVVSVVAEGTPSAAGAASTFRYGGPTVTSVSPASGPRAGATSVTVHGSGFALGKLTTFHFGTVSGTSVNCTSSSLCTVSSPPASAAGRVDVRALVGSKTSPRSRPADEFVYQ